VTQRPNFFIMMAEAWRPDHLGAAGHPVIKTPHMDALAAEGVMFDRAYCAAAQCAPSRTSYVTGMYPHSHGVMFNKIQMPSCHRTMGHYLSDEGYRTAWIGKGHNEPPRADYGFDLLKLSDGGNTPMWDDDYFLWLHEQGVDVDTIQGLWDEVWNFHQEPFRKYSRHSSYLSPLPEDQVQVGWITHETKAFVQSAIDEDRPFCAFASHHAPQNHDDLPEPYHSMYDPADVPVPENGELTPELAQAIASHMGKVSMLDAHVGAVVKFLRERGVLDNTVIVLTSDHACFLGERGMRNKMWTYEMDARIPMIFRYPEQIRQGVRTDALMSNIDALPTMLDLAGVQMPGAIQGVSQLDVLTGVRDSVRETVLCESGPAGKQRKGVWHGDWQLLYRTGLPKVELYNLREDPGQMNDLGGDPAHEAVRNELLQAMLKEYVTTERYPVPMSAYETQRQAGLFNRL
jgi:arylsulfatase A-like enzyme